VVTASSREAVRVRRPRPRGLGGGRLIRGASAWLPAQAPRNVQLQELEETAGIRWVDLYGGELQIGEALALLDPICRGELTPRMARELVRSDVPHDDRGYEGGRIALVRAFRTRRVRREGGGEASLFEPVRLLVGDDWLISCWHAPRVYRGLASGIDHRDDASTELYRAVAAAWPTGGGKTAADLAYTARRQLAGATARVPLGH
jgi:hypothetical protein